MKGYHMKTRLYVPLLVMAMFVIGGAMITSTVQARDGEKDSDSKSTMISHDSMHMTEEEHARMSTNVSEASDDTTGKKNTTLDNLREAKLRTQAAQQERKQSMTDRLDDKRREKCQKRQASIEKTSTNMAARGADHVAVLTKIYDRVKAFYDRKNLSVDAYDALTAEVESKKAAATLAVETITTTQGSFTCDDSNPKQAVEDFKSNIKLRNAAIKEYQTAIKNLIVAVKTGANNADGGAR